LSSAEIPEAYGGLEMDKVTLRDCRSHREVRRVRDHMGGHTGIGTLPIVYFGTENQKKKYLPRLAAGKLLALCFVGGFIWVGCAQLPCPCSAFADGKHYILNARRCGSLMRVRRSVHCVRQS